MAINTETRNEKLYDFLKANGLDPVPKDSKNEITAIPKTDVFKFSYPSEKDKDNTVWATIDANNALTVYYDDETTDNDFFRFLKRMKDWAQRKQLEFKPKNRNHLDSDMAKREYMKQKEKLGESYYPVGKKTSYSDSIPSVKILLMHTRNLEEGEQRFRNVAKIFVENVNGERFLVPTLRPGIARVYARHIAEGGTPYDERGKHITTVVEEYTKMAGFVRATKNGQFNENAQLLVNEGIGHYNNLRSTLQTMTTRRGYNNYFDSWTPVLNEETDEDSNINELFVQETLDPRIESVMPILSRLRKNLKEMDEVKVLSDWADQLINEKLSIDPKKKVELDEQIDEERQNLYLVVDKNNPGNAVGIWDGQVFKPFDKTKFPAGVMDTVPSEYMVDKSAGPATYKQIGMAQIKEAPGAETLGHNERTAEKNLKAFGLAEGPADAPVHPDPNQDDKRWDDTEPAEEEIDEGKNVKYFYVTVDGKEKFKTRNELEAHRIAKEMKADTSFDGKTIDVVEKNDYTVQINENENRESGRALKSLRNLAIMKPELTYVKLEASGLKQIVDNAIKACKDMKRYYRNKNQTPYAQFFYNLENEIENFKKGYNSATYNPDEDKMIPIDLSDLSRGTLGKIKFD